MDQYRVLYRGSHSKLLVTDEPDVLFFTRNRALWRSDRHGECPVPILGETVDIALTPEGSVLCLTRHSSGYGLIGTVSKGGLVLSQLIMWTLPPSSVFRVHLLSWSSHLLQDKGRVYLMDGARSPTSNTCCNVYGLDFAPENVFLDLLFRATYFFPTHCGEPCHLGEMDITALGPPSEVKAVRYVPDWGLVVLQRAPEGEGGLLQLAYPNKDGLALQLRPLWPTVSPDRVDHLTLNSDLSLHVRVMAGGTAETRWYPPPRWSLATHHMFPPTHRRLIRLLYLLHQYQDQWAVLPRELVALIAGLLAVKL